MLDCEQSLFFFRLQGGVHPPVSVSRAFCSTDQEKIKGRLLVVYANSR